MTVSILVAMAEKGVIGRDNGLPWRLSTDLRRFKAMTIGKPIVMGRKCFESIGKPLPGRTNIVITRNRDFSGEGLSIAHSLEEALALAHDVCKGMVDAEICVVGGAEIYRQAMDHADRLYVTHVLAPIEGDAFFPEIDPDVWEEVSAEFVPAGEKDEYPTRFVEYARKVPR